MGNADEPSNFWGTFFLKKKRPIFVVTVPLEHNQGEKNAGICGRILLTSNKKIKMGESELMNHHLNIPKLALHTRINVDSKKSMFSGQIAIFLRQNSIWILARWEV